LTLHTRTHLNYACVRQIITGENTDPKENQTLLEEEWNILFDFSLIVNIVWARS